MNYESKALPESKNLPGYSHFHTKQYFERDLYGQTRKIVNFMYKNDVTLERNIILNNTRFFMH